jgi:hypothetical protein
VHAAHADRGRGQARPAQRGDALGVVFRRGRDLVALEQRHELRDVFADVERLPHFLAAGAAHAVAQLRIANQAGDRLSHALRMRGVDQQPADLVAHQLGDAGDR